MPIKFNRKLLNLAVCSVAAGISPTLALAQEQEASKITEEVVVYGDMRATINSAQQIKRMADTVMDVISASDIGALPDKSVTEALQRVPGVTISHFASSDDPNHYAAEGTGVLVRGLDRVRSEINGRDAFSASPYGGLSFRDIPAELLGSVRVIKNQTADMIAGGIAGTINLVTRKPFDTDGQVFGVTLKGSYGNEREEWTPSASGLYSNVWDTGAGDFGFLIAGAYSKYKSQGDGIGLANFYSHGDTFVPELASWGGVIGIDPSSPVDAAAIEGQEPGTVVWVPNQFSIRRAQNDRERQGLASSLQWRNNDGTIVTTLEYISSEASLTWRENVIGTQGQGFTENTRFSATVVQDEIHPYTIEDGFFTSGIIVPGANLPMMSSARYNLTETQVEDLSFNVKFTPTDQLSMSFDLQHVEASKTVKNNGINMYVEPPAGQAFLDLRGEYPTLEFVSPSGEKAGTMFHPGRFTLWNGEVRQTTYLRSAMDQDVNSDGEANAAKFDVTYELDHDWAEAVQAGIYYSDKDLTIRDTEYSNWGSLGRGWITASRNAAGYFGNEDEFERVVFDDFFANGTLLNSNAFLFPKMSSAKNFVAFTRRGCGDFSVTPHGGQTANSEAQTNPNCYMAQEDLGNRIAGTPFAPHHVSSTNEARAEVYTRFNFAFDDLAVPFRGNIGLRYVNYQLKSTGYTTYPTVGGPGVDLVAAEYPALVEFATGGGEIQTIEGTDYSTVLPSLNLAFKLKEDWILRFGASKGLYFPDMQDTRNSRIISVDYDSTLQYENMDYDPVTNPVVDISNVSVNGIARNPFLEPEESINLDLSSEWYFSTTGAVTLSLFYKDLTNLIQERTFLRDVTNPNNGVTRTVSFSGPANKGAGTIQGAELAYTQFFDMLPGAWSGLGIQMNYTYIDQSGLADEAANTSANPIRFDSAGNPISDARNSFRSFSGLPLEGYSESNYNIIGMYEYGDIAARVAYTWRSDYLVSRRDTNEFVPVYSKDVAYLDASFYYSINEHVKVGIEGSNLLDTVTETMYQLNQEGDRTEALNFKTDRRFTASVQVTF